MSVPYKAMRAQIIYGEDVDSVLDCAYELAKDGMLPIWGSMMARSQKHGRGQMRRHWESPPGNIYAALRLPMTYPFDNTAGAIAVSAMMSASLREEGFPCAIKWPNDLVKVVAPASYGKIGGILLEEKNNILLAGIGINLISAPVNIRDGSALGAAHLAGDGGQAIYPYQLWEILVNSCIGFFRDHGFFAHYWLELANSLFIWKGEKVVISDEKKQATGRFIGVAANGAALLECATGKLEEILNGSMKLHQG